MEQDTPMQQTEQVLVVDKDRSRWPGRRAFSKVLGAFVILLATQNVEASSALQTRYDNIRGKVTSYIGCLKKAVAKNQKKADLKKDFTARCKLKRDQLDALSPGAGFLDFIDDRMVTQYDRIRSESVSEQEG